MLPSALVPLSPLIKMISVLSSFQVLYCLNDTGQFRNRYRPRTQRTPQPGARKVSLSSGARAYSHLASFAPPYSGCPSGRYVGYSPGSPRAVSRSRYLLAQRVPAHVELAFEPIDPLLELAGAGMYATGDVIDKEGSPTAHVQPFDVLLMASSAIPVMRL